MAIFQFNSLSWVYQNMEPLYQLLHSGVTTQEINGKLASPLPILDGVSRATVRLRCDYIIDWVGRSLLFHHDFLSAVSKALNDRSRGHNITLLDTYRAYIRARLSFAGFDQTALAANGSDNALCRLISVRVACSKPFTEHLALAWQAWLDSDKEQEGNRRVFLGLRTDEKAEDVEMQHIASLARAEYVSNNIGWHIPQVEWLQHSLMERIAEPAEVLSLFVDGKGGPLTTASQSDLDRLIKGTLHDFNGEESPGHASSQYFEGTGSHTNTSDNAVVATQYDQRETFEGPLREECNLENHPLRTGQQGTSSVSTRVRHVTFG